jgi:peptidoglycan/xylan/chitin deacetylase (PgdA/CDA1 family)
MTTAHTILAHLDAPLGPASSGIVHRVRRRVRALLDRRRLQGLRQSIGAMVAMYHSVPAEQGDPRIDPRWTMPEARFRSQMEFLRRHCHPMPLREAAAAIVDGVTLPPNAVCVTFDDGYLDNLTVAAPILAELEIPATVFVATGIMMRREAQPIDRLRWLMATADDTTVSVPLPDGKSAALDLRDRDARRGVFLLLDKMIAGASRDLREEIFGVLRDHAGGDDLQGDGLTLAPEDLERMAREHPRIEIGAHSVDHLDLTSLSQESLTRQIHGSIKDASGWTGRQVASFSCPYNRSNAMVRSALGSAGVVAATGDGDGRVLAPGGDPLRVPRFDPASLRWPVTTNSLG